MSLCHTNLRDFWIIAKPRWVYVTITQLKKEQRCVVLLYCLIVLLCLIPSTSVTRMPPRSSIFLFLLLLVVPSFSYLLTFLPSFHFLPFFLPFFLLSFHFSSFRPDVFSYQLFIRTTAASKTATSTSVATNSILRQEFLSAFSWSSASTWASETGKSNSV